MEITRLSQEELLVRFLDNPDQVSSQEWILRFKAELTGSEKLVRVDLAELEALSSFGVNVIVGMFQMMEKQGGTIQVEVRNDKTRRVFDLFKLSSLFQVRVAAS